MDLFRLLQDHKNTPRTKLLTLDSFLPYIGLYSRPVPMKMPFFLKITCSFFENCCKFILQNNFTRQLYVLSIPSAIYDYCARKFVRFFSEPFLHFFTRFEARIVKRVSHRTRGRMVQFRTGEYGGEVAIPSYTWLYQILVASCSMCQCIVIFKNYFVMTKRIFEWFSMHQ